MESNHLINKEKISVEELPEDIKKEYVAITKEFAQYTVDGKDIPKELIERDNNLAQKINDWLDEEIDDIEGTQNKESVNSENTNGEEIESPAKTIKEKVLSVAEGDKVMLNDLKDILGRNPKYPLEQIEDLRLVKILFHPYYQIRNYKEVVGKLNNQ